MNKTIEELAKQYAEDKCPVGDYCGKNSFSFDFKMKKEDFEILMRHPRVIALAERFRKDINSLIEAYGSLKRCGKLNRRERRAREREINKKYGRFVTFCAQNHIQYDIQK